MAGIEKVAGSLYVEHHNVFPLFLWRRAQKMQLLILLAFLPLLRLKQLGAVCCI